MIPFINKTVDVLLPEQIEARTVNVREVIDEFRGQVDDYTSFFEAIVFMAPGRFRVTFKSARKMEIAMNTRLIVRAFPVEFKSVSPYKWVNITRLSYGIPDVAIQEVLSKYSRIRQVKSEVYSNIYTGVRHVLMEIIKDIPTRLHIAGHWCFVHYRGQKRWTSDTPLTQFTPNLPCPTQERIVFDEGPESTLLSEESSIVTRFCGNVSSHEEEEED